VLHYWPNETDRRHLVAGMREMARIAVAGGATGVATLHTPRLQLEAANGKAGSLTDTQVTQYGAEIERRGVARNRMPVFSAHQMGTCRIGGAAATAVADPSGEVYGVRGLYIGDASGCPTALGVNPMITTMTLAHHVARRIQDRA
jgi:choline dehydrogenase-like flavoprotein